MSKGVMLQGRCCHSSFDKYRSACCRLYGLQTHSAGDRESECFGERFVIEIQLKKFRDNIRIFLVSGISIDMEEG